MPRWLTTDEQRTWRAYLEATRLLTEQLDRELQEHSEFSHGDYEVLVRLSEAEGRAVRMSELAERSQSSRSRLSHTVARMEASGWVRRESCPTDGRGAFAVLTDKGFAALESAAPGHVEGVRSHLFDLLTAAQIDQLGVISRVMLDHLTAEKRLRHSSSRAPCPPVELPADEGRSARAVGQE
jgi:DNA-binding MarR family transcriptional regulator